MKTIRLYKGNHWTYLLATCIPYGQGGITCGAIDEPRKSSKAIDERVIINLRDKNVVIARFRDKCGFTTKQRMFGWEYYS